MTGSRRIPLGKLNRLIGLARVGAKSGTSLLVKVGRDAAAEQAAEVLGNLRGLAAKLGQMASYVDGVLPEADRQTYEKALSVLFAAAPSSSPDLVRACIERELGAPLDALFEHFEPQPFASASIGQVHRARLHGGQQVAVKVQHPGIERALKDDLDNARVLERLVGTLAPKNMGSRQIFEVVKARFLEELDYEHEAQQQQYFAKVHHGDPQIRVPEVIASHSRRRVLTSVLASGATLEQARAASGPVRAAYARALWRFVFKGNLVGGRFNADPHPGNYLFHDEGCVTFLDFGCVQPLEARKIERARAMHAAALAKDERRFFMACAELLETRGGRYERAALDYSRRCFEPMFSSPFRMTHAYVRELVHSVGELKKTFWARDGSFTSLPPDMVFLNRLQFGFYSVLARLDVEVDYAAVERDFL